MDRLTLALASELGTTPNQVEVTEAPDRVDGIGACNCGGKVYTFGTTGAGEKLIEGSVLYWNEA